MPRNDRVIRLSQAVTSFGVGAIYDVLGESFILCDTKMWEESHYRGKGRRIEAARLTGDLRGRGYHVRTLHEPVEMEDARRGYGPPTRGLPYYRFPRWLFCSKCRRMVKWRYEMEHATDPPGCPSCGKKQRLTPMRFVVICEGGHLGDVPWSRWAHSRTEKESQKACRSEDALYFRSRAGYGGGLASLLIECKACGAHRSLDGLTHRNALAGIHASCSGKQPWQRGTAAQPCSRDTHVVQRGAGNVYYPSVASALTIPPESDPVPEDGLKASILSHPEAAYITDQATPEAVKLHFAGQIAADLDCTPADVMGAISEGTEPEGSGYDGSISSEEWAALIKAHDPEDGRVKFRNVRVPLVSDVVPEPAVAALDSLIDRVMAVKKLREVRALLGFYRYTPGGEDEEDGRSRLVAPDLGKKVGWLPATEVFGEGLFITLNEKCLQDWEVKTEVRARAELLENRRKESPYSPILPKATPRFVLLHTLAHLLIRRLAFSCGYASASLRERIYATEPHEGEARAGILIYTAAGDSEGTLGGLVRQAEPPRLAANLIASLYDATHCSSDPVCRESAGQGVKSMNLGACHACALIAETSCVAMNLLLDRVLVVGDGDVVGHFSRPLELAIDTAADL